MSKKKLRRKKKSNPILWLVLIAILLIVGFVSKDYDDNEMQDVTDSDVVKYSDDTDMEIITRSGHPTYYGSVKQSHDIWDDVDPSKIVFADSNDNYSDSTILSMDSYRNSDLIRGIGVYPCNFETHDYLSIDGVLPIVATFMPFDIMDNYYEYSGSKLIVPDADNNLNDNCYYVISYALTDTASESGYAGEHEYSGTIDVSIVTNRNGVTVESFSIGFGLPKWMNFLEKNQMHSEEWICDLYSYR